MSLLLGDTGKAQIGTLKSFILSPGTARETLLTSGNIITLPTTEPTMSQVSFTIQSSDLPNISPSVPMKYNASIICSGKIGASASIVSYRVLKNGTSVVQQNMSSATATQFWTHSHWRTFDVTVGDIIEIKYWAVQSDVTLDFYGLIVYPSLPIVCKSGVVLKELDLANIASTPDFTTTFTINALGGLYLYPYSTGSSWNQTLNITLNALLPNMVVTNGLFRTQYGDINPTSTQLIHATQRQIQKQLYWQKITFREVLR